MGNNIINTKNNNQGGVVKVSHEAASYYTDLAKKWAVKTDDKVDGSEYSAKYYATEAKKTLNTGGDVWVESIGGSAHLYTNGKRLSVQADGNLVLYHNDKAVWYTGTSSLRFKKNIEDITEERAKKILDIRVRTFDYKENQINPTGLYDKVGVIAEEVTPIMRDVVVYESEDDDGNKRETEWSVDYQGFVPYLIKMVQIQEQRIDELEARLEKLEQKENN